MFVIPMMAKKNLNNSLQNGNDKIHCYFSSSFRLFLFEKNVIFSFIFYLIVIKELSTTEMIEMMLAYGLSGI